MYARLLKYLIFVENAPSPRHALHVIGRSFAFLKVIEGHFLESTTVLTHTNTFNCTKMSGGPPKAPGALKQIWYKWKTLRLPWRRQFLAGSDLSGNTFWEFKDALNAQRFRRIVKYAKAGHYSDVKISRKSCGIVARNLKTRVLIIGP